MAAAWPLPQHAVYTPSLGGRGLLGLALLFLPLEMALPSSLPGKLLPTLCDPPQMAASGVKAPKALGWDSEAVSLYVLNE